MLNDVFLRKIILEIKGSNTEVHQVGLEHNLDFTKGCKAFCLVASHYGTVWENELKPTSTLDSKALFLSTGIFEKTATATTGKIATWRGVGTRFEMREVGMTF